MMSKVLLILTITSVSFVSFAQSTLKPQIGLGYTDNANYESSQKDSDMFWWLGVYGQKITPEAGYSLYLNFRDYLEEDQNDRLSYRFGRTEEVINRFAGSLEWLLAVGGLEYSGDSPAFTEETFDNIYLDNSWAKTFSTRADLEYTFEPGLRSKMFTDLDGRFDQSFYFISALDFTIRTGQVLRPFAEIGFVFSNKSIYSNNYLEFGADYTWEENDQSSFLIGASIQQTSYFDRDVTDETAIVNKKGKKTTGTSNETQVLMQLQGSYIKKFKVNQLKSSLVLTDQSSRSGESEYTESQIHVALIIPIL